MPSRCLDVANDKRCATQDTLYQLEEDLRKFRQCYETYKALAMPLLMTIIP